MKKENFTILFVIKLTKLNGKGLCPVNVRITYQGIRKENATGYFVDPKFWDAKRQLTTSKALDAISTNIQLELIKQKIKNAYLSIILETDDFEADDIYHKYLGKPFKESEFVVRYFQKYLDKIFKLIGKDLKLATWKKYNYACIQIVGFIKFKYKKNDISLDKINLQFLTEFEYYLKTEQNQCQSTINKAIQRFRRLITIGIAEGFLEKDPFILYKAKKVKKEVIFLTHEELETVEKTQISQPRLALVKDLFVFCCYTGLAYVEMAHLSKQNIQIGFDDVNWIQMKREKTQRQISIPLLSKAQEIIEKYSTDSNRIFPSISNQKFNSYLKEIADVTGIEKRLTHHIARKTFASTVLLYNDVPMEIVSELLGHSNMVITQESYGKVVQKKVSEAMISLSVKLK
ncbi:site-specific integrase [Flavobacterium sp. LS1P28]|uniref:site-specific integrase n=1 Tax=Flavobacterium sp. LS1P28 TaxID=2497752 RepID=UPI000F831861|nr:site-specific integrase [Flavobacterium sp. LS1P28]RTY78250.1 site-specific integrase [Flavobacterium sp. LS1P28]